MYWKSNPSTAPPTWMALLMTPIGLCSRQHPFYLFLSTYIFLYILEISVTGWMHLGKGNLAPSYRMITDFMTGWEEETLLKHLQSQEHCSAAGTTGHGHPDRQRNVQGTVRTSMNLLCPRGGSQLWADSSQTDNRLCPCPPSTSEMLQAVKFSNTPFPSSHSKVASSLQNYFPL